MTKAAQINVLNKTLIEIDDFANEYNISFFNKEKKEIISLINDIVETASYDKKHLGALKDIVIRVRKTMDLKKEEADEKESFGNRISRAS